MVSLREEILITNFYIITKYTYTPLLDPDDFFLTLKQNHIYSYGEEQKSLLIIRAMTYLLQNSWFLSSFDSQ